MQKIKQFLESEKGKDILIISIVVLVGLASFGLGRLSKEGSSGLKVEYTDQSANVVSAEEGLPQAVKNSGEGKNFFASSRGSKYYPSNCEAGNNIKKENRVYFDTREDAESAGYELSGSCR